MIPSRFVVTYPGVRPGEHVLYDLIEDRYAGIDDAVLNALERGRETGTSPPLDEDVAAALLEQQFLVRDRAEDDARLRRSLEAAAEGIPGTLSVTVMPTLACNLACTYCFQKDHPAFTRMTEATEASTVEWILRRVDATCARVLSLHYFGGEPLSRKDLLLRTAEILSSAMAARGGRFEWFITTNGVSLDSRFVDAMSAFGPGGIKVTLDGDQETHDAARVFRNGKGSFEQIFARLAEVARSCAGVKLRVGGNFRAGQLDSYERLLDRIEAEGLGELLHEVHFKPVVDSSNGCNGCGSSDAELAMQQQLARSVERRGIGQSRGPGAVPTGPCELHWKNSFVIDPEGRIYKCPAVAGRPEMAVAHVGNPISPHRPAPLLELRPWEKCGDCPFLPVCVGGCLGGKYLQTGRRDQVFCRRPLFERATREAVVERYLSEFPNVVPGEAWSPPEEQPLGVIS